MTGKRSHLTRAVPGLVATAAVVAGGCFHRGGSEPTPPAPSVPQVMVLAPPPGPPPTAVITGSEVEAAEPYIERLVAFDSDVRLVLERIAELGKLDLIISGRINKKITVEYFHVPVSVALKDVLTRAGLQLGYSNSAPLPFDTVTVFFRLPANVDSLSVDGIIRRFGVSRAIAELIVKSRRP